MNTLQLEQLISGYIDHELSIHRMQEVEVLLRNDAAVKKLYDDFIAIRKDIRAIPMYRVPQNFQKDLFQRIDMEIVNYSGTFVHQQNETNPSVTESSVESPIVSVPPTWENHVTNEVFAVPFWHRMKNPRIWAFPMITLLIGLAFYFSDLLKTQYPLATNHPANGGSQVSTITNNQTGSGQSIDYPKPPLSSPGKVDPTTSNTGYEIKNGETCVVIEVRCTLSEEARKNEYFPKLLADAGFTWEKRTDAYSNVTIYEFKTTPELFIPIISKIYLNQKDVISYHLPPEFPLFIQRSGSSGTPQEKQIGPTTPILVRFLVDDVGDNSSVTNSSGDDNN